MNEENHRDISRGKETLVGFDRKIRIGADFLRELEENDITKQDFTAFSEDILIVHGMKDEIVPVDAVRAFAEENLIEFVPVEKADHRFIDPNKMSEAVARMVSFLFSEA